MGTTANTANREILKKHGLKEYLLSQRNGIVFSCINSETERTITFEIERPDPYLLKVYVLKRGGRRGLIGCIYPYDEYKHFFKPYIGINDSVSYDVFKWLWYYCHYNKLRTKTKLTIVKRSVYV